jgi:hypothetical protein
MAFDPFARVGYRANKRVKWEYYHRLVEALAEIGISENSLPRLFPRVKWQDQRRYLENRYDWLFYCVRCHLPYDREKYKDPVRKLCLNCSSVYEHSDEMIYLDDEGQDEKEFEGKEVALSARRYVMEQLASKRGERSPFEPEGKPSRVDDILNRMRRTPSITSGSQGTVGSQVDSQVDSPRESQHESPVGVSKTDVSTDDSTEKP